MTTFARYLQAQMDEHGWTRAELARQAGFNRAYVTDYLNHGVIPGADNRQKIAKALGVDLSEVNAAADGSPTHGVFELSPDRQADAQTLSRSQSELVYEIIRHLAEGNRQRTPLMTVEEISGGLEGMRRFMERTGQLEGGGGRADSSASNEQASGSGATEDDKVIDWPHGKPSGPEVSTEEIMHGVDLAALEPPEDESQGDS